MTEASRLYDDPRVRAAQRLLQESKAADGQQIKAARWWGRLESALTEVLDAIGEVPPF